MPSLRCVLALALLLSADACAGPPLAGAPGDDDDVLDATPGDGDAADPKGGADAAVATGPQTLVLSDVHVASFTEDLHALSLLGTVINPQLEMAVANGQLLLGVTLEDLDDPSGQDDADLAVGLASLTDSDADATDNFDAEAPETFSAAAAPVRLEDATLNGGELQASGVGSIMLPGSIPLPLQNPELSGTLVPSGDGSLVKQLTDGRLRGGVPASLLSFVPNLLTGTCPGGSLLDTIATGCGLFAVQPDAELDGDGLEELFDEDGDGAIDRCVDGDGTEILGTGCVTDARIKDGYQLILVVEGVRAIVE